MSLAGKWLLMFALTALVDIVWSRYTIAAAAKQPIRAGLWAVGIYAGGSITTLIYVRDPSLLWPCLLGAFVGTWYGVRSGKP